jgi:hypothetical protein
MITVPEEKLEAMIITLKKVKNYEIMISNAFNITFSSCFEI